MAKKLADLKRHESVSEFTAERMLRVIEQIESQPERYDQNSFGDHWKFDFTMKKVRCNTACCFAGHTVAIFADGHTRADIVNNEVGEEACRLLGVSHEKLIGLFKGTDMWPWRFKDNYGLVGPEEVRARVEHYIETGSMSA